MKLVGLMHVRNEQWILGLSLPALLRVVDEVVILDHASTDATPDLITEAARTHPGRVHTIAWEGRHYDETAIRQRLLDEGRRVRATHLLLMDADEIVTGHCIDEIRAAIGELAPGEGLELPWLAMWGSLDRYRADDSVWSNNRKVFAYADAPSVAHRALDDGYDMHQQTPRGLVRPPRRPIERDEDGGVMHLQFAHRRRLLAKHAWYKMSETVRFPGRAPAEDIDRTYNQAMDETDLRLAEVPAPWWDAHAADRPHVHLDDAPWHEAEVLRFWREHGPDAFAGLELWGLPQRLDRDAAGGDHPPAPVAALPGSAR